MNNLMTQLSIYANVSLAMLAFAANSIICRLALHNNTIDPASFTSIRLLSGALILILITQLSSSNNSSAQNVNKNKVKSTQSEIYAWLSGFILFIYAVTFSFAYINLSTATGALLLFGAVQSCLIAYSLFTKESFTIKQGIGILIAIAGLIYLFLPHLTSPSLFEATLMLISGVAWAAYTLLGKNQSAPIKNNTSSFIKASIISIIVGLFWLSQIKISLLGLILSLASGAIASGLGYAIWYLVLPNLKASSAASVQLTVPVIAAIGGIIFLNEDITLRLILASVAILGGVALSLLSKKA